MSVTFSLSLPLYLKQWLIFQMGGVEPVQFPKGSPYNQFLRVFLRNKHERESWIPSGPDSLRVVVPKFPGKDPAYHNFLPLKAQKALAELIRDSFDVQLFREMSAFRNVLRKKSDLLSAWMEENGIEMTDTNWCAVAKRLQLLRARAYDRDRKRSHNKIREDSAI